MLPPLKLFTEIYFIFIYYFFVGVCVGGVKGLDKLMFYSTVCVRGNECVVGYVCMGGEFVEYITIPEDKRILSYTEIFEKNYIHLSIHNYDFICSVSHHNCLLLKNLKNN